MLLTEIKRTELVSKSRQGKPEKGDGKTRYQKRLQQRVASSTKQYNDLNTNKLFKQDILNIAVPVKGETDDYIVRISYGGFLAALKDLLNRGKNEFSLRTVIKALVIAFNKNDVYLKCSCPDWKYRFHYWATKKDYNEGEIQLVPTDSTNPDDDLGAGCKHVLMVLSNTSWLIKVASVIVNYTKWMERHQERLYQKVIYPAIYEKEWEDNVQLDITDLEDDPELISDTDTIDKSNKYATDKNKFKKGNEYRIRPKDKPIEGQEEIDLGEEDSE